MKITALKKIAVIFFAMLIAAAASVNAFAETIEDRVERELNELLESYQTADEETQQSLQERFNAFLEENGLEDMDLSSLLDTDVAQIISDLGDNLALEDFLSLAEEAFNSGYDMIQDVINGGLGTSDGSNTATTSAATTAETQATNVIVAVSEYTTAATTASASTTEAEVTTYDVGETTAAGIVGAGVTVTSAEAVTGAIVSDDEGLSTSSMVVLVVLSVATIAVIVAIVIFFMIKRK